MGSTNNEKELLSLLPVLYCELTYIPILSGITCIKNGISYLSVFQSLNGFIMQLQTDVVTDRVKFSM